MRRAIFLDRDGVLNASVVRDGKPYPPTSPAELVIPDEVPRALLELRRSGFVLICVTNQPDVGRGTQLQSVVEDIHEALRTSLQLDDLYVCYDGNDSSPRKKPNPGMIFEAATAHAIDLSGSFMVGDRWRDCGAGHAAGCRTVHIERDYQETWRGPAPDFVARSLSEAASIVIRESSGKEFHDNAQ